jgi:hypothetical protein
MNQAWSSRLRAVSPPSPSMSTIGRVDEFVPRDFDVPRRLETPQFVLEPLEPEHNLPAARQRLRRPCALLGTGDPRRVGRPPLARRH